MAAHDLAILAGARREAALVRALLQELEQLTGEACLELSQQLAEELALLAQRLLAVAAAISADTRRGERGAPEAPARPRS